MDVACTKSSGERNEQLKCVQGTVQPLKKRKYHTWVARLIQQ